MSLIDLLFIIAVMEQIYPVFYSYGNHGFIITVMYMLGLVFFVFMARRLGRGIFIFCKLRNIL